MKVSIHLMPALFLLALLGFFTLAYLSPMDKVMAEGGESDLRAAYQAEAQAAQSQQCEDREVEADEGYGVSHKETRRVCR